MSERCLWKEHFDYSYTAECGCRMPWPEVVCPKCGKKTQLAIWPRKPGPSDRLKSNRSEGGGE